MLLFCRPSYLKIQHVPSHVIVHTVSTRKGCFQTRKRYCPPVQGSGFSEVIAGLEAELKSVKAANVALADDNRGCYAQIRAKDKELDMLAAQVEHAKAIAIENKVTSARFSALRTLDLQQ